MSAAFPSSWRILFGLLFIYLFAQSRALELPVGPPLPAPTYMVNNQGNTHHAAPDKGTQNGPVLPPAASHSNSTGGPHGKKLATRSTSYWLANMVHGQMPYAPSGYPVWRNVMDYGATGDGTTDDTAAINAAITAGGRCGQSCGSSSTLGAVVYFPPGTYAVSSPIIQDYYTQFIGDPTSLPTIKGLPNFAGIALIDTDIYVPGGNGSEWYINQNQFYRQIRNFNFDLTAMPFHNVDGDQTYVPTGIHWQVAQSTSLQNLHFNMPVSNSNGTTTAVGIFTENGSGGFMSDLTFVGGNIGMRVGSQQFTASNLQFTSCLTAVSMIWDWGWTWKNVQVTSCWVAFDCTTLGGINGQGVGSLTVLDSNFNGVPYAITVDQNTSPAITLDNLVVQNTASVVLVSGGATLLAGPSSGSQTIASWGMGRRYSNIDDAGSSVTGVINPLPSKPASLTSNGAWFQRSRPQYETLTASSFINVLDYGAVGDGTGDQSAAINKALASANGAIVFFPAGVYAVQSTVFVPVGSRIVGEAWPQIMGTGSYFEDVNNPKVMVQVGNYGDVGVLEISDILFTVSGPTAGAILVQWNVQESSQGSAGMWDSHFRVGGAIGSNLQSAQCPAASGTPNPNCIAATMLMHLPAYASGYFENIWGWVADHDLDTPAQTQINIFSGRGLLIESAGPVWLWGTSFEHSVLYQYQLSNATNIFMAHLQTETPYYQASPPATQPFTVGMFVNDPLFENCLGSTAGCAKAWALRIIESSEVFIYGAGVYSFFEQYSQTCLATESCQVGLIDTSYSQGIWLYSVFTKGATQSISPEGGIIPVLAKDNQNGYLTAISAWLSISVTGGNLGGMAGGNGRHTTPSNVTIVPLPCTTVPPSQTFTMSAACTSGIAALPTAGTQNTPPGPSNCTEDCDFFRELTQTCCGNGGSLGTPILWPPGVAAPFAVPFPVGYIPNIPFVVPLDAGLPATADNSQTIPCCVPLVVPVMIPPGWIPVPVGSPGPGLIIPVGLPLSNSDPPSTVGAGYGVATCDPTLSGAIGLCGNGNFPLFTPDTGLDCSVPDTVAPDFLTSCQSWALDNPAEVANYIEVAQQCLTCPGYYSKRSLDYLAPLMSLGNESYIAPRQAAAGCPPPPPTTTSSESPGTPPCSRTFVCDGSQWPNICGNAESAISIRGYSSVMTKQNANVKHSTKAFFAQKYGTDAIAQRDAGTKDGIGWGLVGCNVEEYPFASGRPAGVTPVLRLVPQAENSNHAQAMSNFYLEWQKEVGSSIIGNTFCISFINSQLTADNDWGLDASVAGTLNMCAQPYGPEFLLVTGSLSPSKDTVASWDPWFNAAASRVTTQTILSIGTNVQTRVGPPMFCKNPSPGLQTYDSAQSKWTLHPNGVPMSAIPPTEAAGRSIGCAPVPQNVLRKRRFGRGEEQTQDLVAAEGRSDSVSNRSVDRVDTATTQNQKQKRQLSFGGGSYLDVNLYQFLPACLSTDDFDPCYIDQCIYYDAAGDLDPSLASSYSQMPTTTTAASINPTQTSSLTCYAGTSNGQHSFDGPAAFNAINSYCDNLYSKGSNYEQAYVFDSGTNDVLFYAAFSCFSTQDLYECPNVMSEIINSCDAGSPIKYGGTITYGCIQYQIQGFGGSYVPPPPPPTTTTTAAPQPTPTSRYAMVWYYDRLSGSEWQVYETSATGGQINFCAGNYFASFYTSDWAKSGSVPYPNGAFNWGNGCTYTGTSSGPGTLNCGGTTVQCQDDTQDKGEYCSYFTDYSENYPRITCFWP